MELRFKEWLNEASRWKQSSWKPPAKDALERLRMWNKPGYYCHFTNSNNKLGMNPTTMHTDTPYGIYAYTVDYAVRNEIVNLPYANERAYVWVFKARTPQRIKRIKDRRDKAGQIYVQAAEEGEATQMAGWFLRRGIEGFVDNGTSTIHPSEPYQAVFFGSQTIIPVDVFPNTLAHKAIDSEEQWQKKMDIMKKIGAQYEPVRSAYGDSPWDDYEDDFYDPYEDPEFIATTQKKKKKKKPLF